MRRKRGEEGRKKGGTERSPFNLRGFLSRKTFIGKSMPRKVKGGSLRGGKRERELDDLVQILQDEVDELKAALYKTMQERDRAQETLVIQEHVQGYITIPVDEVRHAIKKMVGTISKCKEQKTNELYEDLMKQKKDLKALLEREEEGFQDKKACKQWKIRVAENLLPGIKWYLESGDVDVPPWPRPYPLSMM